MNLQARYDLEFQKDQLGGRLEREGHPEVRGTGRQEVDTATHAG